MDKTKISVQVPVYNAEKYIVGTLRSILADPLPELEVIAVDDCSTDRSLQLMRQLSAADTRLRVECNPHNLGVVATRKRMQTMTAADYLVPFDADDIMLPHRLGRQMRFLDAFPAFGAVYGKTLAWNPDDDTSGYYSGRPFSNFLLFGGNPIGHGSIMFRRQAMLQAGGYIELQLVDGTPIPVSEDYFLFIRLSRIAPLFFDPSFAYVYRLHQGQMTRNKTALFECACHAIQQWFRDENVPLLQALLQNKPLGPISPPMIELMQALGFLAKLAPASLGDALPFIECAASLDPDDYGPDTVACEYWQTRGEWTRALAAVDRLLERFQGQPLVMVGALKMKLAILRDSAASSETVTAVEEELAAQESVAFGTSEEHGSIVTLAKEFSATAEVMPSGKNAVKISVHVAAFNAQKYISACLRSILSDPMPELEVIVLDDGSTDNTLALCRALAAKEPRLRVEHNDSNLGIGASRRRLSMMTDADYIVPFDADDLMLPGRLRRQMAMLDRDPALGGVYGKTLCWEEDTGDNGFFNGRPFSNFLIHTWFPLGHGAAMLRREAILAVGNYMPITGADGTVYRVASDHFLFLRLGQVAPLRFEHDYAFIHRRHSAQITQAQLAVFDTAKNAMRDWFKRQNYELLDNLLHGRNVNVSQGQSALLVQSLGFLALALRQAGGDPLPFINSAKQLAADDYGIWSTECEYWRDQGDFVGALALTDQLLVRFSDQPFVVMIALKLKMDLLEKTAAGSAAIELCGQALADADIALAGTADENGLILADAMMFEEGNNNGQP